MGKLVEAEIFESVIKSALKDAEEGAEGMRRAGSVYAIAWEAKCETYKHVLEIFECCTIEENKAPASGSTNTGAGGTEEVPYSINASDII